MDPSRIFSGGSILILFLTQLVDVGDSNTAAQCAQFGVNDKLYWEYGNEGANTKQGYVTIAGKEYDAKWIASIGSRYYFKTAVNESILPIKADGTCPWEFFNKGHRIEPCVDNKLVRMDMYLVKQHGHVLRGWVHVEIELLDKDDVIELLYIQMRDEAFNAIGEFATPETHDGAKCKPTKSYLATPKHYEFFPCSATGLREAKTSQAIMMAKKEYYFDQELVKNGWVYDGSIERGIHFLWKFDEYWCSRHWRFQPYAYIMTRKNRLKYEKFAVVAKEQKSLTPNLPSVEDYPRMLRKVPNHWLYHQWIGAADIILGIGELDCSELAIDDNTGKVTPAAVNSWFVDKHPENSSLKLLEDNWHPKNRYVITKTTDVTTGSISYGSNLCQADPLDKKQTINTVPVFSGRCQGHFEKAVSRETFQGCNTNASSQEFEAASNIDFTNLTAYRNKTTKDRLLLCTNITCKSPDSEGDLKDIKQYEAGNMTKNASEYIIAGFNDRRTKSKIAKFWHGRKYHGVLCSIVAFFITPVYIFIARYFKETYLRSRCFDIPVWYWWHAGGVIISATLFASSYAAMSPNFPIWGRSEHSSARIHMISGYASIVIFGIIVVFGGCRCAVEYDRGKCMRLCSLTTHAVLGSLHHLLNLFTIITSAWIPQSPALNDCDKKKGMPEGIGLIVFVAAGFLVVEFLFHLLLTILLCMTDKKEEVNRGWWCPILPFLPISVISDYSGATARKIMLALYVDITLAFALVASGLILKKELPENCRIGPMTCKHVFGCTKLAIQYEKWFLNNGGNITGLE